MERGKGFIWGKRAWRISFWGIILFWLFSLPSFKEEVKATREAEETREVKEVILEVRGDLITLNFQDADIREVLRLLSTHAGINIVPDAAVTGKVTIALREVSWERALDIILRTQRLISIRDDDIIRVAMPEKFREEEERERERRRREEEEEDRRREREELKTQVFPLNFAQAAEIKESIAGALSERGEIIINKRKNALLITDTAARLVNIEEIMRELDTPTVQVNIEAKLIEVTLREGEDIGIDWNVVGGITQGVTRPITFPFQADHSLGDFAPAPGEDFPLGEFFPFPDPVEDFTFGVLSAEAFRAVLHLLETQAETRILSAPTVTTLSNEEARLHSGVRHPVPTMMFDAERGVWEVTGYEFIEVGVILTVTPTVRPGGEILMELKPEVSEILKMIALGGGGLEAPLVATKEAETRVMVGDGETLVIGGLMRTEERESVSRVPLLGDLPFLGGLFRKKGREEVKTDLLIFVTASIVQEPALLSAHQRLRLEEMGTARQLYEEEQRVEKYYLSGKRYFRRGDYEGAIIEFEGVLDFDPEHRGARRLLRRAERLLRERGE